MISILSDPAVYSSKAAQDFIEHISTPGYGCMNMIHAEMFKAVIESKGTIDIAKIKDAELLTTFFQATDFAERLDAFVQKHGPLDMSIKTLSGKPMLLHMIETVDVTFETALTLMSNPNITNVDWYIADTEGHTALERLYQKSANMPAAGMNNSDACEIITLLLSNPEFNSHGLNESFWETVCNINPDHFITFQDMITIGGAQEVNA